ncbi:bacillithiol system redox-active protein YtxJ [Gracilibacillus thailandensis]|uniref:Bacillithiol system redox-active protein YtxJ n=1 Tax=Gracilibacillus thailandensis TaxID=563735 RepID=A0A6N7R4Q5_9BACI|nr:bacillithiol system redox-active protein YtxJ [Gracilibacillus thailandensis]MRI68222.1 bacillithiol system redox-active protein YtxJ [Gracilibacillus thailandensis]
MEIKNIDSVEQFKQIVEENQEFVLLKHSLTCPISTSANQKYEKYSETSDCPLFRLHVQHARELSNYIADTYQIKHESPQVIKIADGEPTWNTSHSDITVSSLESNC